MPTDPNSNAMAMCELYAARGLPIAQLQPTASDRRESKNMKKLAHQQQRLEDYRSPDGRLYPTYRMRDGILYTVNPNMAAWGFQRVLWDGDIMIAYPKYADTVRLIEGLTGSINEDLVRGGPAAAFPLRRGWSNITKAAFYKWLYTGNDQNTGFSRVYPDVHNQIPARRLERQQLVRSTRSRTHMDLLELAVRVEQEYPGIQIGMAIDSLIFENPPPHLLEYLRITYQQVTGVGFLWETYDLPTPPPRISRYELLCQPS